MEQVKYTISTHNGSSVAREHNRRNAKVIEKESHIDKSGVHKNWIDINPRDAYNRLFSKSIQEYNHKQKESGHNERCISDYYSKINNDKKKHPVYEMIIGIGSYTNHPDHEVAEKILKEFVDSWQERNPNLFITGAYYHADEEGAPHCHIDYIPICHNQTRGPSTQTGLVKALNEQGYYTDGIHDTAQIKWEKEQNKCLEELCNSYELEIEHPETTRQNHLKIQEYKAQKRQEELEIENERLTNKVNELIEYHNNIVNVISGLEQGELQLAKEVIEKYQRYYEREERTR